MAVSSADAPVSPALDQYWLKSANRRSDEVEPRGDRRREMQVGPRIAGEPPSHAQRLVRAVVIDRPEIIGASR